MRIFYLFFFILLIISLFSYPASGLKFLEYEENYSIYEDINDDLYIIGGDVFIYGSVRGDVFVLSGNVEIFGNITGDVMVGAGDVAINGNVEDDVRIGAGTLILNGKIGDDLLVSAGNVIVSNNTNIGGDLIYVSNKTDIKGDVNGDVCGISEYATLSGHISGNTTLEVGELNILPSTRIDGNLTYSSPKKTIISPSIVGKNIHFEKKIIDEEDKNIIKSIIWWLIKYSSLLIIGLLALALAQNLTVSIAQNIPVFSLVNLLLGLVLVVFGFSFPFLLFVTVVGLPLGILILFVIIVTIYTARLFFGLWLGRVIFSRLDKESKPWMDMVLGLFILSIFTSLPWIGFIIYLFVTFISIGSVFRAQKMFFINLKRKGLI